VVRHADRTYATLTWLNFVKFSPVMRLSEFLMGMAIGYAVLRDAPKPARAAAALLSGVALLTVMIAVGRWVPYAVMHTGLTAPAFGLIVYGLTAPPKWTAWLAAKPLTVLGDASLSFYLLHANFIGLLTFGGPKTPNAPLTWGRIGFTFLFVTALSLAMYRWFEVPARKRFDPARKEKAQAPEPVVRVLVGRSQDAAERTLAGLAGALDDGDQDAYPTYLRDPAAFADHRSAVAWALENGLGFGPDRFSADVEVPSEVLLALVRADFRAPFTPMPARAIMRRCA